MVKFLKKPWVIVVLSIIVFLVGFGIYKGATKKPNIEFIDAKVQDVIQEVSVTGRVNAAESVELAFEASGRVGKVNVKVGDRVLAGTILASLQNGDLEAKVLQVKANLNAERAKLDELRKGTRLEELQKDETTVNNAKVNLVSVENKADADLESDYAAALSALQDAVLDAKGAILTLTDIQEQHFTGSDQDSLNVSSAKDVAVNSLLGISGAGTLSSENLSRLNGGVFGEVQAIEDSSERANIDNALIDVLSALRDVADMLDLTPVLSTFSSTQKTNLATEKSTVASAITNISSKKQDISVQMAVNASNIATAKNTLKSAEDDLALSKAGSTEEQISIQEARVASVEATVKSAEANLLKTLIRAPINGLVTEQNAKVGETVSVNKSVISLIADANFEIEANVPEADIAKLKVGDKAIVTLDAYGTEQLFNASIISINPAETIIDGVATYKTTLQFDKEDDRIKSGMTANIDIQTNIKNQVLSIPVRAVINKDGQKIVRVLENKQDVAERKVITGLRGSYGNIEIVSGLKEGDKVILFIGK